MSYTRENHHICAYLRRHVETIRNWDKRGAMEWVRWFIAHGRCLSIYDKGTLVGVTLVRRIDQPEQANAFYMDTGGPLAYIEVCACKPNHMPYLFTLFKRTFPGLEKMAWCRSKYNNRPLVTNIERAERRLTIHG